MILFLVHGDKKCHCVSHKTVFTDSFFIFIYFIQSWKFFLLILILNYTNLVELVTLSKTTPKNLRKLMLKRSYFKSRVTHFINKDVEISPKTVSFLIVLMISGKLTLLKLKTSNLLTVISVIF
jgi:hypothetical protein